MDSITRITENQGEAITKLIEDCPVLTRPRGNNAGKKRKYLDIITAFDIETTSFPEIEQASMYIWQFAWGENTVILGRTYTSLISFFKEAAKAARAKDAYIVMYVHFLSHEFQYFSGLYHFRQEEVFAVRSHHVAWCLMSGGIEFRCSHLLTNMSLEEFTKKMGVEMKKGEMDYTIIRTSATRLTTELDYGIRDVIGLVQALKIQLETEGDTLYTVPMTSTGYVRRDMRRVLKDMPRGYIQKMNVSLHQYKMLSEAFRGGDTHANRYYTGRILTGLRHADRKSSYPGVICNRKYPVTRFRDVGDVSVEQMRSYLDSYAVLTRVRIWNLRLRDEFSPSPYISYSKCRSVENAELDNGRILRCDYMETTVTDIDLKIIVREYECDVMEFFDCSISTYGTIPKPIIELIETYFAKKTELDGNAEMRIYYTKAKNKLNSIYGMMATDIVRQLLLYIDGEFRLDSKSEQELLNKYNARPFLPYQWGVWTTAHARYEMREGIWLCGDGTVYHDTDGIYYLGDVDWSEYNNKVRAVSQENGAYATDRNGVTHYMEVYEEEELIDRFLTWGAKRYAYEIGDELYVTISGVSTKTKGVGGSKILSGKDELLRDGGLEALQPDYVFSSAVSSGMKYNTLTEPYIWDGPYGKIPIINNIYSFPRTYTLTIGKDYKKLLSRIAEMYSIWYNSNK